MADIQTNFRASDMLGTKKVEAPKPVAKKSSPKVSAPKPEPVVVDPTPVVVEETVVVAEPVLDVVVEETPEA